MSLPNSSFIIGGTGSGSGKTTVTLALLAALSRKGLEVQAFKAGPDYIDPTYHNFVLPNQKSRNLDFWLCSENQVKAYFDRAMSRADVGVVEGVMGLFDGKVQAGLDTSTASLAKKLNLPVILVMDASGMAQSAAAVIHGFIDFDPQVNIAGVILNRVGSEGHYQYLKEIIESRFSISVFGWLPDDPSLKIPERHLGLVPSLENSLDIKKFITIGAKYLDLDFEKLRGLKVGAESSVRREFPPEADCLSAGPNPPLRLGLAYDKAFHFYYEDALDEMRSQRAEIISFSPLNDDKLPPDLDMIYFGGGFPEVFEKELKENQPFINSFCEWLKQGKPVYAECGGLIYLVNMGLIPGRIQMTDRLQHFGYKEIQPVTDNFLFKNQDKIRVHEFHYSKWKRPETDVNFAFQANQNKYGFWNGQILASYYHCHLGAYPQAIRRLHEIPAHKNLYPVR